MILVFLWIIEVNMSRQGNDFSAVNSKKYSLFPLTTQIDAHPITFISGQNEYIQDSEGKKYFDLSSQYANVSLGYNNTEIIAAANQQMQKLHYTAPFNTTEVRARLCEKIITEIAPDNMAKVFLTLGGSDSNDIALRIAKSVTGKNTIFSQYHSYHGATLGAANLSGDHERLYENLSSPGFVHFFGYNSDRFTKYFTSEKKYCQFLLDMLEEQIQTEDPGKIAAIFFETMSMTNLIIPPLEYYQGIRKLCDKYNILLIFDEVLVGFGRTGKWFACEHYGIQPDIITMGKGINSSYLPLGGVLVSKEIADKLEHRFFSHTLTASFHAVSCASALASIEYIQKNNIIENAAKTGAYFKEKLHNFVLPHPYVKEIRGIGMFHSMFFCDELNCPEVYSAFQRELLNEGLFTFDEPTQVVMCPPLTTNEDQIDAIILSLDKLLTQWENNDYAELVRFMRKCSNGLPEFFLPDKLQNIYKVLKNIHAPLLLGSANIYFIELLMRMCHSQNKEFRAYLNTQQSKQLNETFGIEYADTIIEHPYLYYDKDIMSGNIQDLEQDYHLDAVIIPYSRDDASYQNILETVLPLNKPVYLIRYNATILKLI